MVNAKVACRRSLRHDRHRRIPAAQQRQAHLRLDLDVLQSDIHANDAGYAAMAKAVLAAR